MECTDTREKAAKCMLTNALYSLMDANSKNQDDAVDKSNVLRLFHVVVETVNIPAVSIPT